MLCSELGAADSVLPSLAVVGGLCQPPTTPSSTTPALCSAGAAAAHQPARHPGALPAQGLDASGLGGGAAVSTLAHLAFGLATDLAPHLVEA